MKLFLMKIQLQNLNSAQIKNYVNNIKKYILYIKQLQETLIEQMNEELNQFSKLNIPQLLCQNKCQAKMLCCNPQCDKMALVCRQSKCPCMPKEHRNCQFLYTQSLITQIVQKKGVLSPQISKAAQKIDQIYLQAIEKLSMDRQSLQIWKQNFGLTSNQAKLIQLMKTNKMDQIKGNLIYEIKQNVNKNNQYQWLTQQWVKDFWTKNQIDFNRIFAQLNKFHRQFNYQYATSKLQIPSFITKDVETIGSFFEKEISQYRLLYRASQQQFSALKFHQLCDGVKNTMTLALTQYGKIIGGFTPMPWRSTPGSEVQADVAGQSFLFSVSLAQKYSLTNPNIAIAHNRTRGPMFGEGRDLCISDQSNIKKDSFANFPYSYNNGAYKNNQIAHTALTGNQKGYYMHLKQWEVFQVIWKQ